MSNQPPQGGSYDDGGGRFDAGAERPEDGHGTQPGHAGEAGYGNAPAAGYGNAPGYQSGPAPVVAKPKSIDLAQKLMYVGAVLSVISGLSSFLMKDQYEKIVRDSLKESGNVAPKDLEKTIDTAVNVGLGFGVLMGLLGAALWVLMAVMNGKGKSWARIVATVLGVIGIVSSLFSLAQPNTAVTKVLSGILALLAIAILVLLWKRESSEYYQAQSAPRY